MNHQQLLKVITEQERYHTNESFIPRYEQFRKLDSASLVTIITGIRRCGKSTLLNEIRFVNGSKGYYLNFDDDRLINFKSDDFQLLTELFIEKYGKQNIFYFDEIQNIVGWERFIRRLHDQGSKVYITGSNARMLSRELGTHLTGRYIQLELYPFSFSEFTAINQITYNQEFLTTTEGIATLRRHFNEYLESGGMPEYLKTRNKEYLKTLYEGILYRDILTRHNLTKEREIKELLYFIAGNVAKEATQTSLAKIIGIKNSTTVKDYLTYFEDSYMVFTLYRYDNSIKRQLLAPRKVYFIDNALAATISFRQSDDYGRWLENIVFFELKR
ncbi:MAG TPA: ATP-binding protein, partial [Bacteroidales bacterium]